MLSCQHLHEKNELLVLDIFVILNFVDIKKKEEGINFVIIKSVQVKMKIWLKMFSSFWTTEVLKELVITVGNEPILINTFFHFGILWKPWCPVGHDFENRINLLITPSQAIGHKTPDLETYFSNSSEIRQQKWWVVERKWQLVIWYASRLATASSLPKPSRWPKTSP